MTKIKPINLSPSFLSKVISKGYDYAVGEKLNLFAKDTKNMSEGRIVHAFIAHRFGHEAPKVVTNPYDSFRSNAAKEWRDSQPDDVAIIKHEDVDKFNSIADRVFNHPKTQELLDGHTQVIAEELVQKEVGGFNIKGFIDLSIVGENKVVIDWKYLSTTSFDKFTKQALYDNYDLQSSIYDFLKDADQVYFGVIESEAPYRIKYFLVTPSFLESGADKFNKAFDILKQADWREPTFDITEVTELIDWNNFNG